MQTVLKKGTQTTEWVYKVMTRNLSVFIAKVNADCHQVSHSIRGLPVRLAVMLVFVLFVLFCLFFLDIY